MGASRDTNLRGLLTLEVITLNNRRWILAGLALLLVFGGLFFGGRFMSPARRPAPGNPLSENPVRDRRGEEPTISLYLTKTGEIRRMKLDDYVQGVVAAEIDPDWPEEALKAQAILARTFTLQKMAEGTVRQKRGTDASDDPEEFQAYDATRVNDRIRRAVEATRGLVVTYEGRPIRAWFHSHSGGRTATAREGLNFDKEPTPYIRSIKDPASLQGAPADRKSWTAAFSPAEVARAACAAGKEVGEIRSISIGEKGPSGRAMTLEINGTTVPAADLRRALGSDRMRSTLLDEVSLAGGKVTMKGRGWGHGVGMSQWGAAAMARQGKKAEDIIRFYFQGISLERRW